MSQESSTNVGIVLVTSNARTPYFRSQQYRLQCSTDWCSRTNLCVHLHDCARHAPNCVQEVPAARDAVEAAIAGRGRATPALTEGDAVVLARRVAQVGENEAEEKVHRLGFGMLSLSESERNVREVSDQFNWNRTFPFHYLLIKNL